MNRRITLTLIILALLVFAPYWVYLPALIIAILITPLYWEAIPLSHLITVLYGPHEGVLNIATSLYPALILVVLVVSIPIRERVRLYA